MRKYDYTPFHLNKADYEDKLHACWLGKNIGGTMGAPFEGTHKILDIPGFTTSPDVVMPNDDLDLQLVWIHAMEEVGPYNLTPQILGEMWLSFIYPHFNEYGIGMVNMSRGLIPPVSGQYKNEWKNSNGAWIRTEVWASLLPASPDAAAKYAYYDGCVDHGHGEGTYAAAFVAAMESAAYVVNDIRKLINIGLARIPEDCRMAKTAALILDCYDSGKSWKEARNIVQQANADIGDGWFEAPSNVGYVILGLLYGEGDFKKSMITAINCGDDTDCTGATIGSIMGIMGGTKVIPEDWKNHIGDKIVTQCLASGVLRYVPETCTELSMHVSKMAPTCLFANRSIVEIADAPTDDVALLETSFNNTVFRDFLRERKPYSYTVNLNHTLAEVAFESEPNIAPGESVSFDISFTRNCTDFTNLFMKYFEGFPVRYDKAFGNRGIFHEFRWILPEGWTMSGPQSVRQDPRTPHGDGDISVSFTVTAGESVAPVNRLVLEVVSSGRLTVGYIPITLIG